MRRRFNRHLLTAAGFAAIGLAFGSTAFAQTAPINLSVSLGGVNQVTGLGAYIVLGYNYAISVCAVAATIMLIYGGFRYLMGSAREDVARGKEIIRDSIIGMILVLSAWLILHTVNPATLNMAVLNPQTIIRNNYNLQPLSDCSVRNVQQSALTTAPAGSAQANAPVQTLVANCALDSECSGGSSNSTGVCMRTGYYGFTDVHPLGQGPYYPYADLTAKPGRCSEGLEGHFCRCSGQGCQLTTASYQQYFLNMSGPNYYNGSGSPGESGGLAGDAYDTWYRGQLQTRVNGTNNHGTGVTTCLNNLPCVFLDNHDSGSSFGWYCTNVPRRDQAARPGSAGHSCVRDSDCTSDQACIRTDWPAGTNSGECSPKENAPLGALCKCSGYGCGGRPYNNGHGDTLQTNVVHCAQPLVCALYGYSASNNPTDPPIGNWYCTNPDASDAGRVAPTCLNQTPGTGTCNYSCTQTSAVVGTTTAPLNVVVPCSGATQAEADQVCQSACASGANSCATRSQVTGATCATSPAPNCAGWTPPGGSTPTTGGTGGTGGTAPGGTGATP